MTSSNSNSISIITATFNSASVLPRLIDSLIEQTDQDFEWIVADGGSRDETLRIIEKAKPRLKKVTIDSQVDFGIYDALNRGIRLSTTEFYLVLGSDDTLHRHGVEKFKNLRDSTNADLISCKTKSGNKITSVRWPRWEFLFSQFAHVASHAVGLLIRKKLHESVGYYSKQYPIAADQLFILSAISNGAKVYISDAVVGTFSEGGISNLDAAGSLTEMFRINVVMGHNFYIQLLLFILRIIKNRAKVIKFKIRK